MAEDVATRFRACLGRLPVRVPASPPEVDRRFVIDGIAFERWLIRGPSGSIPAWFLFADTAREPAPAVLALHGHGRQFELGKSLVAGLVGEPSRAYGFMAARAGFAVLVPDLPGFEDRRPPIAERKANYALQGEAYERLLAMNALVQGQTLQGSILADLAACLDVLELDRRVDAARIAALGQSFGGQEVLFAMLFDARLRAGITSCGFSLVRLFVERSISHNMAVYLPGMLPDLDFDQLVPAIAPRALSVIAGRQDAIFPVEGVEQVEAAAKAAWQSAGAGERLRFRYFDGPHGLPPSELADALEWLGKALG